MFLFKQIYLILFTRVIFILDNKMTYTFRIELLPQKEISILNPGQA